MEFPTRKIKEELKKQYKKHTQTSKKIQQRGRLLSLVNINMGRYDFG